MSSSKTCRVELRDPDGTTHEVEASASSVYEAAAPALRAAIDGDWSAEAAYWTGCVEIAAKQPDFIHKVLLKDIEAWLKRPGGNPRESTPRQFVRRILKA